MLNLFVMAIKDAILKELDRLPQDKLDEVLDFVTSLREHSKPKGQVIVLRGLWAGKVAHDAERELKKLRRQLQRGLANKMNL